MDDKARDRIKMHMDEEDGRSKKDGRRRRGAKARRSAMTKRDEKDTGGEDAAETHEAI